MAVEVRTQGSSFVAGKAKELFQARIQGGAYDVARDGRFLISTRDREEAPAPITLVVNWHAGLQKK
jgi:hypothetical protein